MSTMSGLETKPMSGLLNQATDRIVAGKVNNSLRVSFDEKYKNNPISIAELKKLVAVIKENDLCNRLRLTTGNCGVMAITLRHMLGGRGQLWRFGNWDDETCCAHIVLQLDGRKYIDGNDLWKSKAKIKEYWDGYDFTKAYDEEIIVNHTTRKFTVEIMEKIFTGLLAGQVPSDAEIMEYRRRSGY